MCFPISLRYVCDAPACQGPAPASCGLGWGLPGPPSAASCPWLPRQWGSVCGVQGRRISEDWGQSEVRGAQSLPNGKSGRRVTLRDSGVSVLHIGRKCKDTKTSRKETNVRSEARTAPATSAEEGELETSSEVFPRKWGAARGCWGPGCTGKAGALSVRLGDRFCAHATPSRHRFPRVSAARQQDGVAFSSALGFTALLRTWEDTPGDGGASTYNLPGTRDGQGCFRRRAADLSCIRDCEGCAFLCPLGLEYVFQVCVSDGPQLTLRRSP